MGDRYLLRVKCKCGFKDDEVWYAPTSNALTWKCPKCQTHIDLEKYSGISAVWCANTFEGAKSVREELMRIRKELGRKLK